MTNKKSKSGIEKIFRAALQKKGLTTKIEFSCNNCHNRFNIFYPKGHEIKEGSAFMFHLSPISVGMESIAYHKFIRDGKTVTQKETCLNCNSTNLEVFYRSPAKDEGCSK